MDIKKLALFFAFAFVITGIVVYQVRSTRGKAAVVSTAGSNPATVAASTPQTSPASLPPVSIKEAKEEEPRSAVDSPVPSIPTSGWGRSPFLTVEENRKLQEPAPTPVTQPAAPLPVVEPLPQYVYQGTLESKGNLSVFISDKTLRVGDKIGKEVVKEIKEDSVILEKDGKTRELSRRTNPEAAQQPKGDK